MNNIFYEMIFKRKSFHIFRNVGNESIGEYELGEIQNAYSEFTPLNPERRFGVLFKEELDREYVYMIRGRSRTVLRGRTRCFFVSQPERAELAGQIGGTQPGFFL